MVDSKSAAEATKNHMAAVANAAEVITTDDVIKQSATFTVKKDSAIKRSATNFACFDGAAK